MSQLVTASAALSLKHGIDQPMLIQTVKQQCFPSLRPEQVSNEQTAMFLSVCHTQDLNPFIPGMVYAYPTKNGGITPVIGPDGVFKKLAEMKGVTYECEVFPENPDGRPTHAKASIYVEGRERPYTYTAYFSEWVVGNNPNWNSKPRHMIWLRALKQCARQVIHGMPMDEDEVVLAGLKNVTDTAPDASEAPVRPAAPERSKRGVAAAKESKAAAVEVEVVTPASETPKPANAQAEPVTSQASAPAPVEPAKVETPKPTPAPVEKKPEPAPAPKAEPAPAPAAARRAEPVTSLADKQVVTFEGVTVERYAKKTINGTPSVEVEVKGGYTGKVYHIGGAENPAWQIEKPVTVTLSGKKLTSGAVITLVDKVEITEVSAGGDALELS